MFCPECEKQGLKSKVYIKDTSGTLVYHAPFFDEDGRYHNHDSNIYTIDYRCSNRHVFSVETRGTCWCGWRGK